MEALGINFKLVLAQIINFGLFFFIFKKFVADSFMDFINKNKQNEQEKQRILEKLKNQEEEMKKEETTSREKLRREMNVILNRARKDAEKTREELINAAKKEIDDLKAKTSRGITEEREALHKEIRNRIANVSVMMINTALKSYLTEEAKKTLTQHILKNLNNRELQHES